MAARWILAPRRPEAEATLCRELAVSPRLARLLANRNQVAPATAADFLESKLSRQLRSPLLFSGMAAASTRVVEAIKRGERIGIFGDYDVDGISGSASLIAFFRALGQDPALYIPHRVRDGYGLSDRGMRALAEQGCRVIITVDCGGCSHREIGAAQESGIDVIVCDHHQVSGRPLPARAVLNPIEPDAGFPFQGLCGAGVSFYLLLGTRMRLREEGGVAVPDLRRWLDLVTLGTIADIVPMLEENRVLVKYGLREIAASVRPGMMALKSISGVKAVNTGAVGFRLAPRLNAGGRLADAAKAVDLLTTDDAERARQLAEELDQENRTRRVIEGEILAEALRQIEADGDFAARRSIVLASDEWHPGVIGIVASRLVERFYRPTALIALNPETGLGRGSCRGIRGVHLYQVLQQCAAHLEGFGGHRMAAGMTIRSDRVGDFAVAFDAAVSSATSAQDFVQEVVVDDALDFGEVDDALLDDLDRLEPFGPGNAEPLFISRGATVLSRRVVGESHLRLFLRQQGRALGAIAFGMAEAPVEVGDIVDLLGIPERDDWNGGVCLRLKALRPAAK